MAATSPWSVKGVDPETREAAKIAARRAGMTVGQWLSYTIRTAAAAQLAGASRPESAPPAHANGAGDAPPAAPPGAGRPPAPTLEMLFENVQKLASRLEKAEMQTAATLGPLAEQIGLLSRRVDEARAGPAVSTAPVERAVARLAERLETIESRDTPRRAERRWRLFGG